MSSRREIENLIYAATRLSDSTQYEEMYDLMEGCVFIMPSRVYRKSAFLFNRLVSVTTRIPLRKLMVHGAMQPIEST